MDDRPLFDELLRVAAALGVAVRVEPFETPAQAGGGSCIVRGERLIVIDSMAPLPVRIAALARALSELETDAIFMVPAAREAVEAMRIAFRRKPVDGVGLGGCAMPRYEFLSEKCQEPFELTMTIAEHEKGKVRCPTCKSTRVVPQLGAFMGQTAKKS
jgi:hypothetical protein